MSITARNLTKRFGALAAVDDVSFDIPQNAFFAIVGASGCGKSTLLRLIAGLETPDSGSLALHGAQVAGPEVFLPPEDRAVGVVFQSYALWPHLTVEGNVAFPYEARGLSREAARSKAAAHLETVALTAMKDRRPEALSGGQRQRVALARCLAGEADTILMDEPLANLDPHLRSEMETELKAFHRRSGVTTLYITHDQREAMALADIMAVMDAGRFLQIGSPQEIYDQPATATVARFIGRGTVVPAILRAGHVQIGHQNVAPRRPPDRENGMAQAFLRPRDIGTGGHGVPAVLTSVYYRGGVWEATAAAEGIDTPLMLDLDQPATVGEGLWLTFKGCWLLPG
ncbi:ABC transporter ATP-binding protein [uncultured Roseobacter sp.]|uniref:ABC transporter ATP-binding protein n=1 Tax=uncultured Roseobacter sp. TaxID=114847 RepID=UPI00261BFCB2|nr:ABC transporter ATP-binding protein [uncultured Roseobacter sp.]